MYKFNRVLNSQKKKHVETQIEYMSTFCSRFVRPKHPAPGWGVRSGAFPADLGFQGLPGGPG